MTDYFYHSPENCNEYITTIPLDFSHRRYLGIQLRKLIYRWSTNSPFLSQGTFSKLCDLRIRTLKDLNKKTILNNTIVSAFVNSDLLELFLNEHPASKQIRILFTGSSDRNFDEQVSLPENIEMWLCQNSSISDNKRIFTLPIGLEDISLGRAGRKKYFKSSSQNDQITGKIMIPPMSNTNPIRRTVTLECLNNPLFDVHLKLLHEEDYFTILSKYKFVLCLEGRGYENHRIWEVLYQGNFPVMLKTKWSSTLRYLGLPILFVDSISDIEPLMLQHFREIHSAWKPSSCEILWHTFWEKIARGDLAGLKNIM